MGKVVLHMGFEKPYGHSKKEETDYQIHEVQGECKLLREQIADLNSELQNLEETELLKRKELVSKNEDEVQLLKTQVNDLREELEKVLGLPKKGKKSKKK